MQAVGSTAKRRVVLDIEATGNAFGRDPRVCEIAAIEFDEHYQPVSCYQQYVNPVSPVTPGAFRVHGLANKFLKSYPRFFRIREGLVDFLQGAEVYAHGAENDRRFLEIEFERDKRPGPIPAFNWVDTVAIAKRNPELDRPGLDGLCDYFGMDLELRERHGALTDCALLLSLLPLIEGKLDQGWEPDGILEWVEDHEQHWAEPPARPSVVLH